MFAGRRAAAVAASSTRRAAYATQSSGSPFDRLDIRPVQRPDTAAYFMVKPKYADLLSGITSIVQQHGSLHGGRGGGGSKRAAGSRKRARWLDQEDMAKKLDVKLTVNEYKTLQERLNQADRLEILDEEERTTVQLYLNQFRRGYRHMEVVKMDGEEADKEGSAAQAPDKPKKKKKLHSYYGNKDDLGRWFAGGRRKTARACVWLTPVARPAPTIASVSRAVDEAVAAVGLALREAGLGPAAADAAAAAPTEAEIEAEAVPESVTFGEVLVNGKPLADYFVRRTDRESVVFPFQVAQRLGHYYAFLKVSGGGSTGQAEACQLAVARALAAATGRDGHYSIRAAGLLTPDGRAVERKKTGKPKARKSYTWVKR